MKRKLTHKQIKDSGWLPFIDFVVRGRRVTGNLKRIVLEWEIHQSTMLLLTKIEKSIFNSKYRVRSARLAGISKQIKK